MNEDQVRKIAADAASQAVFDVLTRLGISTDTPIEMQRDMQHLRAWRQSMEQVQSKSILAAVGLAVSGIVALVVIGLQDFFRR